MVRPVPLAALRCTSPRSGIPRACTGCADGWTDKLEWGGDHFFDGPDASFFLEDDQNEPVLRAMVRREDGEAVASAIELAERIRNEDGNLVFSMSP